MDSILKKYVDSILLRSLQAKKIILGKKAQKWKIFLKCIILLSCIFCNEISQLVNYKVLHVAFNLRSKKLHLCCTFYHNLLTNLIE